VLPCGQMVSDSYRNSLIVLTLAVLCPSQLPAQQPKPPDSKALFEHGERALSKGQNAVAERDFNQLLRQGSRSAPIYTNLGVVYLRTNRPDAAIRVLAQAEKLAPAVAGIHLNLGLAYFRKREFKRAATQFGTVISADPANLQAHYLQGICRFMMDDFGLAISAFEPILDQEQDDLEYLYMLGTSYGMLKRDDDARKIFERLVKAGGETPHLHLLLGKAYLALGQNEKAEQELQRAAAGQPLPYAHYYLGVLYRKVGKLVQAAAQFEKEIETDPGNPWAFKEISEIKLESDDTAGAILLLEKGTAHNPDAPDLFAILGRAYLRVSNVPRATTAFRRAIALDGKNGSYHFQLSRALLSAGRGREANTEIERARTLMNAAPEGQMGALSRDQGTSTVPGESH
jgi:Flp pilus assembly protein TadD